MTGIFRNLLHVLRRYKVASIVNIAGLSLAFAAFIVVAMHVRHEYGFDSSIPQREYVFQPENLRNDGTWESNWARPQIERFVSSSPQITSAGVMNNISHLSFEFGFATSAVPGAPVQMSKIERIRPGFIEVTGMEILAGSEDNFQNFGAVLLPESLAEKMYGEDDPVGKLLYPSDFRDIPATQTTGGGKEIFTINGFELAFEYTVGGVYKDFPENCRFQNAVYTYMPEGEMMNDWNTGSYYCFVRLSSPESADDIVERYMAENKEFLVNFGIEDIRLRPLTELYFGEIVRGDSGHTGNKLATDMLMLIGVLIIIIALINYVNFSVALAPVRIRTINTRKVLGCTQGTLRVNLVFESLAISVGAFILAVLLILLLQRGTFLSQMMGHTFTLSDNVVILVWTAVLALVAGLIAGLYPAFYMTSFPPAMAINGSYSLTGRAKATRKLLIGFQYVISIALITGALFIALQNRYIRSVELGFDKEKILEVRLGMGTALTKNDLFRELLIQHPDIDEVAFGQYKFVTDEAQSIIGYFYRNEHSFMGWRGVSPNFPEVMGLEIIAGRHFRPSDEEREDDKGVVIINETAARAIMSRFPDELTEYSQLIGTTIRDNDEANQVEIVGIALDFHYESLYREIKPFAFFTSAKFRYRRDMPENFSYVKVGPGDPTAAIEHIRQVINQIDPGYPADIKFFDDTVEKLYSKSRKEGMMVTVFSLLAIIISLVGVFGLVIFESQRREKEIAVRKVMGAGISQILVMFNSGFMIIVGVCFLIAAPLAWFSVGKWLQNFAYKTPMHVWVFIVALLSIALLTVATVTFQSYRTATENPARKLQR